MANRVHAADAARAIFLLLGIPFHVATYSIYELPISAVDMKQSVAISVFISVVHAFRMFAFFVLSGFFSAMVIQKRGRGQWGADRFQRIGFPLAASLLTLGVAQHYIFSYLGKSSALGFLPISIAHIWFLIVLLGFVGTLYVVPVEKISSHPTAVKAVNLVGLPGIGLIVFLMAWGLGRSMLDIVLTKAGVTGILRLTSSYIFHLPAFMLGAIIQFGPIRSQIFGRATKTIAVFTAAGLSTYVALDTLARPALGILAEKTFVEKVISNSIELPVAYLTMLCVFTFLDKSIRRSSPLIDFFVGGAMAIYLFHMIWTLVVVTLLRDINLSAEARWLLGSLAVLLLSIGSFLIVRRNEWLSAAYCGTRLPGRKPTAAVAR